MGPVRDPIKSLVDCGIGDDIKTVIVDGVALMRDGVILGIDFATLREHAQAAAERIWDRWRDWDTLCRTAAETSSFSLPLANPRGVEALST